MFYPKRYANIMHLACQDAQFWGWGIKFLMSQYHHYFNICEVSQYSFQSVYVLTSIVLCTLATYKCYISFERVVTLLVETTSIQLFTLFLPVKNGGSTRINICTLSCGLTLGEGLPCLPGATWVWRRHEVHSYSDWSTQREK